MNILFTGASSFTGFWFVRELVNAGHKVTATFTGEGPEAYDGIRKSRVEELTELSKPVFGCKYGSELFMELLDPDMKWDVFCHHAADVTNYKSLDYNVVSGLSNNTSGSRNVLGSLKSGGCRNMILTGSVFEQNEGAGSGSLRAFSPYGLTKGLTSEYFRYYCEYFGVNLGKFVIPNPFGPYEEPRFTTYLIKNWIRKEVPTVNTPDYVRDNIHVSLLAKYYLIFLERFVRGREKYMKINPSGYAESQGSFTRRFSAEMKKRLSLPCEFKLNAQTDFSEPLMRINTDVDMVIRESWDEGAAWDELAEFYHNYYALGL